MKLCTKAVFSRAATNRDGLKNICKACERKESREYRQVKAEIVREKKRMHEAKPETKLWRRAYERRYLQDPQRREARRASWREFDRFRRVTI